MKILKLTSRNTNQPIQIFKHMTWGHLRNPDGSTCVISNGGASINIQETPEEFERLLNTETETKKGETKNDN